MRPCLLALLAFSAAFAAAEEPTTSHTIVAVKVATPPTIDGVIHDDEWKDVPAMEGMVDAMDGQPAPEQSTFWLGYDAKYIYFAARLHDTQPGAIKATEYRTNVSLIGNGDDVVQLDIDPYGALTDWSHFTINPKGATGIVIAGGRAAKREWVGEFVAKAHVTPDGWEAEARIPWALMKLPGSGQHEIRFDFDRFMARTNRWYDFTNTVGGDMRGVGKWENVDVPKVQDDKILELLPYTYQGLDTKGGVANGGMDMKMPVGQQMTLVGTVNPDFRNIANQILSIDFSRFARLAAESRPFFQEGNQYYGSALIRSQRIHDFDTGMNVYGKVNDKLAMGVLNTSNFGQENDLATTWQYSPNTISNFRFSHTNVDSPSIKNRGYLEAFTQQLNKYTGLFLRDMSSQDATNGKGEEHTANVSWQQGESMGSVTYQTMSPKFDPRLGFFPETDFKGWNGTYTWDHPIKSGKMAELMVDGYNTIYQHFAGGNYRREAGGDFSLANRAGMQLSGNVDLSQFEGSNDHTYTLGLLKPRNDPFRHGSVNYTWGRIDGSQYRNIAFGSAYRPWNRLQLGLTAQFVHLVTDQRQLILSGNYDMGNDKSLVGRLVESNNDINAYVALERSGNAGTEFFLILGDPNATHFRSSLILKVTYPLQMFLGKHG